MRSLHTGAWTMATDTMDQFGTKQALHALPCVPEAAPPLVHCTPIRPPAAKLTEPLAEQLFAVPEMTQDRLADTPFLRSATVQEFDPEGA